MRGERAARTEGAKEEDTPMAKTVKGAVMGLAAGTMWGSIVAAWDNVPRVKRHVATPGFVPTLKMYGSYGTTLAAVGVLYIGVEHVVQQSQGKKPDFGAIGASLAGAFVYGYRGKNIRCIPIVVSCLAFTSAMLDIHIGGDTTRVDNGKKYYAYTAKKKPAH